jgi:hypothetical protein
MTMTNDRPDLTSYGAPAIDKIILLNVNRNIYLVVRPTWSLKPGLTDRLVVGRNVTKKKKVISEVKWVMARDAIRSGCYNGSPLLRRLYFATRWASQIIFSAAPRQCVVALKLIIFFSSSIIIASTGSSLPQWKMLLSTQGFTGVFGQAGKTSNVHSTHKRR